MRETWTDAVFSAMWSSSPISRFVRPWATSPRTSRSRGVRPSSAAGSSAAGRAGIAVVGAAAAPDPAAELGLTPRERSVLGLVAQGQTNREIGERLFMAEKTASVHVSRILAKLDVRSRTEAAAVAHRLGLESDGGDAPVSAAS
ncbi:MAG: family ATPase [Conexibacter sp.]|nr:family ATPase [Conexibacter sp.]